MKKIIILFLILIANPVNAQIKGKITDTNGNPLSFVSVYLEKTIAGTTSNDNGDYILNIKILETTLCTFNFWDTKHRKKK